MDRTHATHASLLALSAAAVLGLAGCAPAAPQPAEPSASATSAVATPDPSVQREFASLEEAFGARLGVYAIDTGTGETVEFRGDERFAFASTYKALAAAAVLEQNSLSDLDTLVTYDRDHLVTYSPITEAEVDSGMTLRDIAAAAVQYSDNTAGNLLFDELGGPEGFESALAAIGDDVTVSEREETDLNSVEPGDESDTSTPRALATDLAAYALGDALSADKRDILTAWLKGNTTGDALIRAGVPDGWTVGDKTGAADYATRNDIAVVWPPDGAPLVMAILSDKSERDAEYDDALIAAAASVVIDALAP